MRKYALSMAVMGLVLGAWGAPAFGGGHVYVDDDYGPGTTGWGVDHFAKIQDGIDAVDPGGVVDVFPGTYNQDEANGRDPDTGGAGSNDFNIFVGKAVTVQGVKGGGAVITSYFDVAAFVIAKRNLPTFGCSAIFVQADDVTITGLDVTGWDSENNKTVEVVGDNFTMKCCKLHGLDGAAAFYIDDRHYNPIGDVSHVQSYHLEGNFIDGGGIDADGIRISCGAGWTGSVANRVIANNYFDNVIDGIAFVGPQADPWDVYPVGDATITGNIFSRADRRHVIAWGAYGGGLGYKNLDWKAIVANNTFDKAAITWTVTDDARGWDSGAFKNVKGIYSAIQRYALAKAQDTDTVQVLAGTYVEPSQFVISKNLTMTGAGAGTTIIKPGADTGGSGDAKGWFLVNVGKTFNLSGVTLDGLGKSICQAIRTHGSGSVSDCELKNIVYPGYQGFGVVVFGDPGQNVTVSGSTFASIGRVGVLAFGASTTTIDGNTYTGKGAVDCLDYAFEVGGGGTAIISDNAISNCKGIAVDLSASAGILVTTYYGGSTTATITRNTITGNSAGIVVGYGGTDTSAVVANRNNIAGNVDYGVISTAPMVDAKNNWWGDATGPKDNKTLPGTPNYNNPGGLGDAVTSYVDYQPWATAPIYLGTSDVVVDDDWAGLPAGTLVVYGGQTYIIGYNAFAKVQDGVNAVTHSTVTVLPGTYNESQIIIDRPMNVLGAGRDVTTINGGSASLIKAGLVRITTDRLGDVKFDGFTLVHAGADAGGNRFTIFAQSSASGSVYTISSNRLIGTNADDPGDYGIYAPGGLESLVFTRNEVTQMGSNDILLETHAGPTEVSYNTLDEGFYGSTVYFSMTYGGQDVTTLQSVKYNTINMGTGFYSGSDYHSGAVTFNSASAYATGNGKYTSVRITDNVISSVKSYRRGISLANDAGGDGSGGVFDGAVIARNRITGVAGATDARGIQLIGLVTHASITDNIITGNTIGLYAGAAAGHNTVSHNDIAGNATYGVQCLDTANVLDCKNNWWGDPSGPYDNKTLPNTPNYNNPTGLGDAVTAYVDYMPVLASPTGVWLRPETAVITREATVLPASFTFNVMLDNVTNLAACIFDANNVPSGPTVLPNPATPPPYYVTPGAWWAGLDPGLFGPNFGSAAVAGGVRILGDLTRGGVPSWSASGAFANLTISYGGVSAGTYVIAFLPTELASADAENMDHNVQNLTVVLGPSSPPSGLHWVKVPTATSTSAITMQAEATDPSGVEYQFKVDGVEQAWQSSGVFNHTGQGVNTPHEYYVQARDLTVDHNTTGWLADPTPPTYTLANAPGAAALGPAGETTMQVNWTDGGNPGGTEYRAHRVGSAIYSPWTTTLSWSDTGLTPNTSYAYEVQARNGDDIETAFTGLGSKYTLANPPVAAAFSDVTTGSIRANWTANSNPSGTLYYCENQTASTNSGWVTDLNWNSTGLTSNTQYTFQVKAKNAEGVETAWTSLGSKYTLAAVPGTPVLTPGTLQIAVSWAANNPALTVFELEVSDGGGFSNIYTGTSTSFTHSPLNPNKQYTYRVRAKNGDGLYSNYSGTASGYCVPAAPGAPIVNMTPMALNGPAPKSLGIESIALNGNPADTLIAIKVGIQYVNTWSNGGFTDLKLGAAAEWQTAAYWVKRLRKLTYNHTYTLQSIAKNGAGSEIAGGSAAYTTNKKGDANRNGSCTGVDLILVRNALNLGQQVGVSCSWGLDVNDSRTVTIGDVVYIRNVILGLPTGD